MTENDLPEQLRIRREKRESLLGRGLAPYPVSVPRTATLKEIRARFKDLEIDKSSGIIESVTGRIIFKRDTGKLCFATLREGDGTELQAMFSLDKVGEALLENWKSDIDLGDIVSVTGEIITSKRGELSILANTYNLASKALRPLPNEHNPLSEETRVRQRYVDLIVRPESGHFQNNVTNSASTNGGNQTQHQNAKEIDTTICNSQNPCNRKGHGCNDADPKTDVFHL